MGSCFTKDNSFREGPSCTICHRIGWYDHTDYTRFPCTSCYNYMCPTCYPKAPICKCCTGTFCPPCHKKHTKAYIPCKSCKAPQCYHQTYSTCDMCQTTPAHIAKTYATGFKLCCACETQLPNLQENLNYITAFLTNTLKDPAKIVHEYSVEIPMFTAVANYEAGIYGPDYMKCMTCSTMIPKPKKVITTYEVNRYIHCRPCYAKKLNP
jgi:hypothetical protein